MAIRPATDPDADDLVALRARRAARGLLAVLTDADVVVVFLATREEAGFRDAVFFAEALATEAFAAGDLAAEAFTAARFFAAGFRAADWRTGLPVD